MSTSRTTPSRVLVDIVEQHAEEAAFLWLLRNKAVDAPNYARRHLARLDDRVEAHVDGLRVAGEVGREIAWNQLEQFGETGEMFAAAVTLMESGEPGRIAPCVDFAGKFPRSLRGLVGAIAWTRPERIAGIVQGWLDSGSPLKRYLGVTACSVHRANPHTRLARLVEDEEPSVRARGLRLVGELGRTDLTGELSRAMDSDADATARFWAAWSLALFTGSPRAVTELQKTALGRAPEAGTAFDLALRTLPLDDAKAWLRELNGDPNWARQVVVGLGVVGDPVAVPWLISRMRDPLLARAAGESLSMITGVDINYSDLDGEAAEGFATEPTQQAEDTDVKPDPDERLPWPDPTKVGRWWAGEVDHFANGRRYLMRGAINVELCERIWTDGYQRQRRAAALELARLRPGARLRNERARTIDPGYQPGNSSAPQFT